MAGRITPATLVRLQAEFRRSGAKITPADLDTVYAPASTIPELNAQITALALEDATIRAIAEAAAPADDLGSAAYEPASAFATAAQGLLAASALQPSSPALPAYVASFTGTLDDGLGHVAGTVTLSFDSNGRLASASVVP